MNFVIQFARTRAGFIFNFTYEKARTQNRRKRNGKTISYEKNKQPHQKQYAKKKNRNKPSYANNKPNPENATHIRTTCKPNRCDINNK